MADPSAVLRLALRDYLKHETGIATAFGSATVKVFDKLPTPNAGMPYLFIQPFFVDDALAECMDDAEVDVSIDVWSLTDPPGLTQAETIAAAVKAALHSLDGDSPRMPLSGWRCVAVENVNTQYLTDPSDGKTVHAVILTRLSLDQVD
jgi:hypothetical protein